MDLNFRKYTVALSNLGITQLFCLTKEAINLLISKLVTFWTLMKFSFAVAIISSNVSNTNP